MSNYRSTERQGSRVGLKLKCERRGSREEVKGMMVSKLVVSQ